MNSPYDEILSKEEREGWESIDSENLTHEIKLTTILLTRELKRVKRYGVDKRQEGIQQVFEFGGSVETIIDDLQNERFKKRHVFKHDFSNSTIKGYLARLQGLKTAQSQIEKNRVTPETLSQSMIHITLPHNERE
jgi:hypothetical protein